MIKNTLIVLLLAISALSCTNKKERAKRIPVVKVNDQVMTASDFAGELAYHLRSYDALMAKDPKTTKRVKESIIMDFVHKSIVQSWAEKKEIVVSDEEVDQEVDKVRDDYPDDTSFRKSLTAAGHSFDEWRDRMRLMLVERKVFEEIRKNIAEPTDEEMRSFYRDNTLLFLEKPKIRLKQILVEKEEDATRIRKGLVKDSSGDDITTLLGTLNKSDPSGDTGWIEKGTLEVFDKAFDMRVGGWSPVLKSAYGYHIYRVLEKRPARQLPYEKAKDKILAILLADREQALYSSWLEEQIRLATVMRNDTVIDAIEVETLGNE